MRALLWLNADGPSDELIAQLIEGADIVAGVDGGSDRAVGSGFEIRIFIVVMILVVRCYLTVITNLKASRGLVTLAAST